MAETITLPPRTKPCSACGQPFACGAGSGANGKGCWCEAMPILSPVIEGADCMCRSCLGAELSRRGV